VASGMLEIGHATDISEGGIGVQLEASAGKEMVGVEVELLIKFPGTSGVYSKGVVRRVRVETGHVLGVQFVNLPAKALDAIRCYIDDRGRSHSGAFRAAAPAEDGLLRRNGPATVDKIPAAIKSNPSIKYRG